MLRQHTITTPVASGSSSRSITRRVVLSGGETHTHTLTITVASYCRRIILSVPDMRLPNTLFPCVVSLISVNLFSELFLRWLFWRCVYVYLQSLCGEVPAGEITPGVPRAQWEVSDAQEVKNSFRNPLIPCFITWIPGIATWKSFRINCNWQVLPPIVCVFLWLKY